MKQHPVVVGIEIIALLVAGYSVCDAILDRWREPITPEVIAKGRTQLRPDFRRKIERGPSARVHRWMLAVETGVKRMVAKR